MQTNPEGETAPDVHVYISTACLHGQCGSCRNTCKYCDSPCRCPLPGCTHRHPGDTTPVSWVDQARGVAAELLHLTRLAGWLPDELAGRIAADPDLF